MQGRFKMYGAPDIKSCARLYELNELEPIKILCDTLITYKCISTNYPGFSFLRSLL